MKLRWCLIGIVALVLPGAAWMQEPVIAAQTRARPENPLLTLKGLVDLCERHDPTSTAVCGSYISGFVDGSQATETAAVVGRVVDDVMEGRVAPTDSAIEAASSKAQDKFRLFCIRSSWTAGYVQAVVVQYGLEHRDLLEERSADHMLKILAKAFPCTERK